MSTIRPKLYELFEKNLQAVLPLLQLAGINPSDIFTGTLKNFDLEDNEILSQNNTAVSFTEDDPEVDEAMEVDEGSNSDMEADENSDKQHDSFRSRSTIL